MWYLFSQEEVSILCGALYERMQVCALYGRASGLLDSADLLREQALMSSLYLRLLDEGVQEK